MYHSTKPWGLSMPLHRRTTYSCSHIFNGLPDFFCSVLFLPDLHSVLDLSSRHPSHFLSHPFLPFPLSKWQHTQGCAPPVSPLSPHASSPPLPPLRSRRIRKHQAVMQLQTIRNEQHDPVLHWKTNSSNMVFAVWFHRLFILSFLIMIFFFKTWSAFCILSLTMNLKEAVEKNRQAKQTLNEFCCEFAKFICLVHSPCIHTCLWVFLSWFIRQHIMEWWKIPCTHLREKIPSTWNEKTGLFAGWQHR